MFILSMLINSLKNYSQITLMKTREMIVNYRKEQERGYLGCRTMASPTSVYFSCMAMSMNVSLSVFLVNFAPIHINSSTAVACPARVAT